MRGKKREARHEERLQGLHGSLSFPSCTSRFQTFLLSLSFFFYFSCCAGKNEAQESLSVFLKKKNFASVPASLSLFRYFFTTTGALILTCSSGIETAFSESRRRRSRKKHHCKEMYAGRKHLISSILCSVVRDERRRRRFLWHGWPLNATLIPSASHDEYKWITTL